MGIKKKLFILTASFNLAFVTFGIISLYSSHHLGKELNGMVHTTLPVVRNLTLVDMVHDGVRGVVLESVLGNMQQNPEKINEAKTDLLKLEASALEQFKVIESKEISPQMKKLISEGKTEMLEYLKTAHEIVDHAATLKADEAESRFRDFQKKFEALEEVLGKTGDFSENENKDLFAKIESTIKLTESSLFGLLLLFVIGSSIASFFIIRGLSKMLVLVSSQLVSGSGEVATAVNQLNASAKDLASNSEEQSSALQETATAMDEISSMVKTLADLAGHAEESSAKSKQSAERGHVIMGRLSSSIEQIQSSNTKISDQTRRSNERFSEIFKVIEEVGNKTKVINDIVFQTKLLSFNASVEAARAGEHGKGFSVVAEEVGSLAQMSGNAAKEINDLLAESLTKVSEIIEETKSSVANMIADANSKVQEGINVSAECSEVLDEIVGLSTQLSDMITNIARAGDEQSKGVQEVTSALQVLNESNLANVDAARQCADASASLNVQTIQLQGSSVSLNSVVFGRAS